MESIGVIGAGTMGCGVSQIFAQFGYKVILIDISDDILIEARKQIYQNIRFQSFVINKPKKYDADVIINNIIFTHNYDELENCKYIIENIPEKIEMKRHLYEKIGAICRKDCILAINTSCISITQLAVFFPSKSNVIGIHFMNPVNIINTVEVIRGYHTSKETIEKTFLLLTSIEKEGILVNDSPGFVSNRISHLFMNEAAFVVQDQVAEVEDVDNIFKKCYGHRMGPLETADLIGIDTVVDSLDVLYQNYQDPKYRCCPLLKKMVHAGKLGRKAGIGFYDYQ